MADGREVIQALQMRPYDLVLMDVRMPEMDGISAAREIRKRWPGNGPRIIAITAYAMIGGSLYKYILQSWIARFDEGYLRNQTFFEPFPEDLIELCRDTQCEWAESSKIS